MRDLFRKACLKPSQTHYCHEFPMSDLKFLTYEDLEQIRMEFGTPSLFMTRIPCEQKAQELKAFPQFLWIFPRYAMKAAPTSGYFTNFQ